MNRNQSDGFTLVELVIVLAVLALLAALMLPTFWRAQEQARISNCISNIRQISAALKMYEADYSGLPIHSGMGRDHWQAKLHPYVKNPEIYLCRSDITRGEAFRWGGPYPCSYTYFYTIAALDMIRPGKSYAQPAPTSPLLQCAAHKGYQAILGRYDGSVELPPPFRYPRLSIQFAE